MPNIARCASALARVILFAAGFAIIATTAEAVPAISPTGAARMEQEKADAREQALKMQEHAAPVRDAARIECMLTNKRHRSVLNRGSDGLARQNWGAARRAPVRARLELSAAVVRELRITGRAAERSHARKRWPLIRQLGSQEGHSRTQEQHALFHHSS